MKQMRWLSAAVLVVCMGQVSAAELVGVPGSSTQLTTTMDITIADKPAHLVLTGVALRQKLFFNVYTIGSYVLDGAAVHTAEAFLIAIRQNYPTPNFDAEVSRLIEKIRELQLQKGDHIYLTHQPGIGLRCQVIGKGDFTIDNPAFSRAVWDIYLGKHNVGEGIKKGLVSRLK